MTLLIAAPTEVLALAAEGGEFRFGRGLDGQRPTCLSADPLQPGRAWCGTDRGGVFRSDDDGASWQPAGLADQRLTAITASPVEPGVIWAGTEPSRVWRTDDEGASWARLETLENLPSSAEWSFPPRPETHHVRWIACQPQRAGRVWVAIEAGALVSTENGGRTWHDRVRGGPYDTHELAIHPDEPDTLRVAAGDGYLESMDGGATWASPDTGLDVDYLRSVAIDPGRPGVVLVSAASGPYTAYQAGRSDGRIFRRADADRWERVVDGWPSDMPTIAPLLLAGRIAGEFWAATEHGVHRSDDGGVSWHRVAGFATSPNHLRGLVRTT